jgi:hypothetical protein
MLNELMASKSLDNMIYVAGASIEESAHPKDRTIVNCS